MRGNQFLFPLFTVGLLTLLVVGFWQLVGRHHDAAHRATAVAWTGFGITAAASLIGALFVIGESVDDPGGIAALGLIALWAVPMLLLCGLALLRPAIAVPVLAGTLLIPLGMGVWAAVDYAGWRSWQDDVGPVPVVVVLVLGAALAVLGLSRLTAAGWLMVVLTAVPPALVMLGNAPDHRVAMSLQVMSLPILLSGLLYLWAGHLEHGVEPPQLGIRGPQPKEPVSAV